MELNAVSYIFLYGSEWISYIFLYEVHGIERNRFCFQVELCAMWSEVCFQVEMSCVSFVPNRWYNLLYI
jgi:hypothetical protein